MKCNSCAVFLICLINVYVNFGSSISSVSDSQSDLDELLFAAIIHRHGDRTPVKTYSTDPHINHSWPGGWGALTQIGAKQLYDVGMNLEPRYHTLKPFDGIYTQETAHAMASSPERTTMSGACMLAAFWKPYGDNNSLPIQWQAVPMEIIPASEDYILYQGLTKCDLYDRIYQNLLNNPEPDTSIYKFNQNYSDLYEYLSEHIGMNVTNCQQAADLYDSLLVESDNGLDLPSWTAKVFPYPLHDCRVRAFQLSTETEYMAQIRSGPVITRIHDHMVEFQIRGSARKLFTYSTHDTIICYIFNSMKIYYGSDPLPYYGACIVFELYRNENCNEENIVQMVYYANSTVQVPMILNITGCPSPCFFSQFENVIQPLLIDNYTQECTISGS